LADIDAKHETDDIHVGRRAVRQETVSEPKVSYATTVSREILPLLQPVEVVDRKVSDRIRLRQAQIDRNSSAAVFVGFQGTPVSDAPARGAEVEPERISTHLGLGHTRDSDAFALVAVCPENAVATTCGAAACGRRLRESFVLPANGTAETRTLEHFRFSLE